MVLLEEVEVRECLHLILDHDSYDQNNTVIEIARTHTVLQDYLFDTQQLFYSQSYTIVSRPSVHALYVAASATTVLHNCKSHRTIPKIDDTRQC